MLRKIIHIDMDAFFASVEERDNPELRGKPIAVGGNPSGRGVLSTANYEARKYGLRSAMSSAHALRLCPKVIFVKPRFEAYKEASKIIREIFFEYTDKVEPLSLDEAYLDVTENKVDNKSATLLAMEIKKRIKDRTDLTASAGVSFNKFLAKVASDFDKPNGLTVITPEQSEEFLNKLAVGKFHGVGRVTKEKMYLLGIETGADLKKWQEIDLIRHFGKAGSHYFHIVRGEDERLVHTDHIQKSVGAEQTFSTDYNDWDVLKEELNQIALTVERRLNKSNISGKTISLKVRYDDFETITRALTFPSYVRETKVIYETALKLMKDTEAGARKVRLLGISVSNLDTDKSKSEFTQLAFNFDIGSGKSE